jgi:hypothetical protein
MFYTAGIPYGIPALFLKKNEKVDQTVMFIGVDLVLQFAIGK